MKLLDALSVGLLAGLAMAACSVESAAPANTTTLKCEGQQKPPERPVYFIVDLREEAGSWSGEIEKDRPMSLSFDEYAKVVAVEWSDHYINAVLEEHVNDQNTQLETRFKITLQIARSDGRFRLVAGSRLCHPDTAALVANVQREKAGLAPQPLPAPTCDDVSHWITEGTCSQSSIPHPTRKF